MERDWSWSVACFGQQNDYMDLPPRTWGEKEAQGEEPELWSSGGYEAAVDCWSQSSSELYQTSGARLVEPTGVNVSAQQSSWAPRRRSSSVSRHQVTDWTRSANTSVPFPPYSPATSSFHRDSSPSPSLRRWKQLKEAGRNWRTWRRLYSRYFYHLARPVLTFERQFPPLNI